MNERIGKLKQQYPLFEQFLSWILQTKVENRLSGGELWSVLNVYSESIADYKSFRRDESR